MPLTSRVAQLGLGLALELGVAHLDAEDRGQAFAGVIAREAAGAQVLEHIVALGVGVEAAGQGRLEPDQMSAALVGVDVVDESEDVVVVTGVVLEGQLDDDVVFGALEEDRAGVEDVLILVEVLDELQDAALVLEVVRFARGVRR